MADERNNYHDSMNRYDNLNNPNYKGVEPIDTDNYNEETAAEVAAPVNLNRDYDRTDIADNTEAGTGRGLGIFALALSVISLFVFPVFLGAVGIIVGFIARRRGAEGLGMWAIGLGAASIILRLFVMPFF